MEFSDAFLTRELIAAGYLPMTARFYVTLRCDCDIPALIRNKREEKNYRNEQRLKALGQKHRILGTAKNVRPAAKVPYAAKRAYRREFRVVNGFAEYPE